MRPRVPSTVVEGLLYALIAFGPFAFGGVEPWSRAAIEVLALALALACFLKGRPAGSVAGSYFWLFPAAVAAFGCLQLATPVLPGAPRPLWPFTAAPYETRKAVMLWGACAAVLWSVPRVVVTPDGARRFMRVLFGVGVALACLGLAQRATGTDRLYWIRIAPKATTFGSYYNCDHAADVLLMALSAGLGLFYARPGRLLAGGMLLLVLGLATCAAQAAFLAVPLAGAAMAFLGAGFASSAGGRRLRAGAALAGAALTVFFAYYHVVASADAGALIDRSVMGRLSIYGDALRWWRDAPLFGTGLGGFETLYPSYQDLALLGTAQHAHSDWIEFALDAGLFGAGGLLLAAVLAAWSATRSWHAARSSEMRSLIGGALAAAVLFAAHALFEFSFQIPANAILVCAVAGFLLSAPSWADKSGERPPETPPSSGAALLAAGYCLVLARAAVLPAVAAHHAGLGGEPTARVVALARASALDDDPAFVSRLAASAYRAAMQREDYSLLRLSLRYALAAAERRPFNTDDLYLAGTVLWRLQRAEDGRDLLVQSDKIRFSRFSARRETAAQRQNRKLSALRALNLAPPAPVKR